MCKIFIFFSLVCGVYNLSPYKNYEKRPLYYVFLEIFSSVHSCINCPFINCCVCVERYVAEIHPINFLKYKPLTYHIAWSVVTWMIIFGFSVFSLFRQFRGAFYYILWPIYILVLFFIKILCSVAVLKALRNPGPGEKLYVKDGESNRMKEKALRVIVIILVFIIITYCPRMVFIFVYDFLSETQK